MDRVRTKKELADSLQVSPRTLCRWLNHRYIERLEPLGYYPRQKIITPSQYRVIREILIINE